MLRLFPQAVLCLVAVATTAFAQTEIGGASLNGTVTDATGAAVANAKVIATNTETGLVRSQLTNDSGQYTFSRLPVGTYDVTAESQGFKVAKRTGVSLQVGAVATLDVSLEIGTAQETVSVTAEAPVVETTRSSAATTVTSVAVANLPVNGRNFIDFTVLTPGVVRDVRGGDLSFAGQRGPSNTLLVDGGDNNNVFFGQAVGRTGFRPYAFSEDAVQEFQVNPNGYPAEIGRAGGGAINVVTKSGTNSLHGSAFEFYRDKGLNANTFTNNRSGIAKQPYHYNQFGGTLGGPILKDKLFYFGSYDGQRNTSTQPVVPNIFPTGAALAQLGKFLTPYQLGLNNDVYLGKIDWNIGANDRLSVRYNASRYNGKNYESFALNSALEHTGDNNVTTDNVAAQYSKVLGATVVWESRFNLLRDDEPGLANASGPEVVIVNGITFGKNNFSPRFTNTRDYQPVSTLSWNRGAHNLKFGADLNFERISNFFPGLFAGSYQFPSYAAWLAGTPSRYSQGFSSRGTEPPTSYPNVNEYAFFAQDTWRIGNRLTLNLGVRYDLFQYAQPTTLNPDPGLAAAGLRTNQMPLDKKNFAPRVGIAYKPFNNERTVVRAAYGIFYARTPSILLSTAMLQNGIDVLTYTLTSGFPTYPNILSAPPAAGLGLPNIYVADPNFRTPMTQQYNFQVEQALGSQYSLTLGYLGVRAEHLTRSRDINLLPSVPVTGTLSTGGSVTYFRHPGTATAPARPNPSFGRITLFDSGGDSYYNGGFIQLTKRFSQNFQVLASYTLSKVIDTAPDPTSVVPQNAGDDAKIVQDTLLPNLDRGPGLNDIRHRFVFSAVWDLNYARNISNNVAKALARDWQLSTIFQAQSGRPYSVTTTGDPNNDGNTFNDRAPGVGRDTYVGPNLQTWDLRVTRDIPLGERVQLRLIGEGFNILNRANFSAVQMNQYTYAAGVFTPSPTFLRLQNVYDPGIGSRALQLAAKITF